MLEGTANLTEKQKAIAKLAELFSEIVDHGFGKMEINISEVHGEFKTRVLIWAGKSYIFFVDKKLPEFNKEGIL